MNEIENIGQIASIKSKAGRYLNVTDKFCQMCDYPDKREMLGITDIELCQHACVTSYYSSNAIAEEYMLEDDEALRGECIHIFEALFVHGKPFSF